jgi:hypothetical protein
MSVPAGLPPTLASVPVAGVSYQFRNFEEFIPENFTAGRAWSGFGISGTAVGDYSVSFDLPPGAKLFDVEWYAYNSSGSPLSALARINVAGQGQFLVGGVDTQIPTGTATTATRAVAPSSSNGPYPHGSRLVAYISLDGTASTQVNGVRVGFTNAPLSPVLLPTPVRVWNAGSHSAITSGQTRTISLASQLPFAAVGALYTISLTGATGAGTLLVGAEGTTPTTIGVQWSRTGDRIATPVTSMVSGTRTIAIASQAGSGSTSFNVDLTGYLI